MNNFVSLSLKLIDNSYETFNSGIGNSLVFINGLR